MRKLFFLLLFTALTFCEVRAQNSSVDLKLESLVTVPNYSAAYRYQNSEIDPRPTDFGSIERVGCPNGLGGILVGTGAFTSLNGLLTDDKNKRNHLLKYGAGELATGLAVSILGNTGGIKLPGLAEDLFGY